MLAGGSAEIGVCRATTTTPALRQQAGATPKQMRKGKASQMASGSGGASAKTATIMMAKTGVDRGGSRSVMAGGKGLSVGGNKQENVGGFVDGIETYLGLIGWRKKCLYTLLLLLMLLIITNLVLTLWILKVMEFSTVSTDILQIVCILAHTITPFQDGMGQLKIVPGGIQLTGQAVIMDMLRASTIRSRHGQPISIGK